METSKGFPERNLGRYGFFDPNCSARGQAETGSPRLTGQMTPGTRRFASYRLGPFAEFDTKALNISEHSSFCYVRCQNRLFIERCSLSRFGRMRSMLPILYPRYFIKTNRIDRGRYQGALRIRYFNSEIT